MSTAPNGKGRPALRIALVGDFDESVTAHRAIPRALQLASLHAGVPVQGEWLGTERITADDVLEPFDAVWCVPASPYRDMDGALRAIRFARERPLPFLGTCGGFQHAVVEYARSVLGWNDAGHAECTDGGGRMVVTPLACGLVETKDLVHLREGSVLRGAYGCDTIEEGYRCSYGLSESFRRELTNGALRVVAEDANGDVRALELAGHPFFVATLFQPERRALAGEVPPIVAAFVAAIAARVYAE